MKLKEEPNYYGVTINGDGEASFHCYGDSNEILCSFDVLFFGLRKLASQFKDGFSPVISYDYGKQVMTLTETFIESSLSAYQDIDKTEELDFCMNLLRNTYDNIQVFKALFGNESTAVFIMMMNKFLTHSINGIELEFSSNNRLYQIINKYYEDYMAIQEKISSSLVQVI